MEKYKKKAEQMKQEAEGLNKFRKHLKDNHKKYSADKLETFYNKCVSNTSGNTSDEGFVDNEESSSTLAMYARNEELGQHHPDASFYQVQHLIKQAAARDRHWGLLIFPG